MARVPLYSDSQVDLAPLPGVRQNVALPDAAFGSVQAQQAQQLARGVNAGVDAFLQAKNEADQTRVDDALNQLRETELDLTFNPESGYTNLKGVNALQRPDGKPLTDEYFDKINTRRGEIVAGLGNDQQRALFERRAADRLTAFKGSLMNYEGDQFRSYQMSVAEGTIGTAAQQVAQFYNDPDKINDGVLSIQAAAAKQGRLQGLSAEQISLNSEKLVSSAHMGAIDQALAANPLQAEQYFRTYKDQMTPQDVLKARGVIETKAAEFIADFKATRLISEFAAATAPRDIDRAFNVALGTESNYQQFGKDGQPLTSKAGAIGIAQVMPKTAPEAAKLAGLPWDEKRYKTDANYNEALGRAYFGNLVKKYGGDLDMSWAAYNGGMGRVDEAMKQAQKAGAPSDWLKYMPAETRDYVRKNAEKFLAGGGRPAQPTLADLQAKVDADPDLQGRPVAKRKTLEELNRRYSVQQQGRKSEQEEAFAEGMRFIEAGGGYDRLPPELKDRLDPGKFDDLRRYEDLRRNGGNKTDLAVYQQLIENPARVRDMSDAEFYAQRAHLSEGDFKKFADMRKPGGDGKSNAGALRAESFNAIMRNRMSAIGLDQKALKNPANAARAGAINKHVTDLILDQQRATGQQMTDEQMVKFVDQQFLRTRGFKISNWFSSDEVRKDNLFSLTVDDIPESSMQAIKADLSAKGFTKPTDQQMLQAYFEMDRRFPNTR